MTTNLPTGAKLSVLAAGATKKLADFTSSLDFKSIPPEVIEHAKLLALDGIGCCLYGSTLPWTRKLIEMVREEGGAARASVFGAGFKTSASQAVLVNSTAGHGFEIDDVHKEALLHAGSIGLPVALACAEAEGERTGRDVLTATVAGYEVGARVGMAATMGLFFRGWHPQGTNGTFVSGPAAASMLRLNAQQTLDAIGIAATQASGLMSAQEGAMVKRMHSGRAAQSGVYGALLARRGFTGIRNVLEADYGGYLSTLTDKVEAGRLTKGLGNEWETLSVGFKPFASVASIHAALDGLQQIMRQNGLAADDIVQLRADVSTMTHLHCAWEYKAQGVTAGQMNLFYSLAAIAVDGDAFVDQYREDRLHDPRLLEFIQRITSNPDTQIDDMGPPFRHAARLYAQTRDGRKFEKEVLHRLGSPENPMSTEQVHRKFKILATHCLSDRDVDDLVNIALTLDEQKDLGRLLGILSRADTAISQTSLKVKQP